MKKFTRIFAVVLAVVLAFCLATTALATQNNDQGKITINNAVNGKVYTIYQILELESFNGSAYSYKPASNAWKTFLQGQPGVTISSKDYVTVDTAVFEKEAFATAALAFAKDSANGISATASKTADASGASFDGLSLGYYLVESSLGAIASLNTTNTEVAIDEKNVEVSSDKDVFEGNNLVDSNDAAVGDTIKYSVEINADKGAQNFVLHDTMDAALAFNASSLNVSVGTKDLTEGTDYTVETNCTDGCTFEVVFKKAYLDTITTATTITVYYEATLGERAIVAGNGNQNDAWLSYGDNNNPNTTTTTTTTTKTWKFDILKYVNGDESKTLDGAGFTLYNDANCTDVNANGDQVITANGGKATFTGLDSGTYYLKETVVPDGYNDLDTVITVVIESDGTVKVGGEAQENGLVKVENKTGSLLPETGGIGTTIFYVLGATLAIAAIVLLVVKKRMSTEG